MTAKRTALFVGLGLFLFASLLALGWRDHAQTQVQLAFLNAVQALNHGDLAAAASKFKQVTELDEQFCSGYFDLGNVYERPGKTDEALSAFGDALKCLKSDSPHPVSRSETIRKGEIDRTIMRIEKLKLGDARPPS